MQATFYFIRSDSRPNLFDRVSQTAGRYVCECEDYTYRGPKTCRHIEQIRRGCGVIAQPKRPTPTPRHAAVSSAGRDLADLLQV